MADYAITAYYILNGALSPSQSLIKMYVRLIVENRDSDYFMDRKQASEIELFIKRR